MTEVDTAPVEVKSDAPVVETPLPLVVEAKPKEVAADTATPATEGDDAAKASEEAGKEAAPEDEAKKTEKQSRFQKRINSLHGQANYWRDRALRAEQVREEAEKALPPLKGRYEYADESEYELAREQRDDTRQAVRDAGREAAHAAEQAASAANEIWREKIEAERAQYPDFEAVAYQAGVPYTDVMVAAVRDHPHGVALAYHLGKNPGAAKQIANMPPLHAAIALGEIAAALGAPSPAVQPAPTKREPGAPPPPPILGGKASGAGSVDLYSADTETYFKTRMKQIHAR